MKVRHRLGKPGNGVSAQDADRSIGISREHKTVCGCLIGDGCDTGIDGSAATTATATATTTG